MAKTKIAITQGDINGIGYELILKNFIDNKNLNNIVPIVYGSSKVLGYYKKHFNININSLNITNVDEAKNANLYVINCNSDDLKVEMGVSTDAAGLASYQALEKISEDLINEKIKIVVNLPVNSNNINDAGIIFSNHPDYFAKKTKVDNYIDILIKDDLRIALANDNNFGDDCNFVINKEILYNKLHVLNKSLKEDFLLDLPKIAVLGFPSMFQNANVNNINSEINNVIEKVKEEGIFAFGTYNADDFFGDYLFRKFDAVLSLNYEQAYIPFKIFANEDGIRYTAGLPFVSVAPINEVAYSNSGKNLTNEIAFRNAINFALDIFNNRKFTEDLQQNKMNSEVYAEDIKKINNIDE